jgi:hypothetical protein
MDQMEARPRLTQSRLWAAAAAADQARALEPLATTADRAVVAAVTTQARLRVLAPQAKATTAALAVQILPTDLAAAAVALVLWARPGQIRRDKAATVALVCKAASPEQRRSIRPAAAGVHTLAQRDSAAQASVATVVLGPSQPPQRRARQILARAAAGALVTV